jgi:2-polyprenyl-6-methoxyphenol hydroxylase-like FAD-dependent oxidoreductase
MEESTQYDVAIVGYGPGAQCLAALLGAKGHRVTAFERFPYLYNLPRAGHIDHEAVRMIQAVGDAQAVVDTMWEVRGDYVWLNGEGQLLMLQPEHDVDAAAVSGWFSDYSQWQPNLEAAFDAAAQASGVEVQLGWLAVGLEQDGDGAKLVVERAELDAGGLPVGTGERRTVRARYVVGADGANSMVRDALGIEREDLGADERWLVCDMRTLQPLEFTPNIGQICDPRRPRMLMPLGRAHRRFEWMLLPHETIEEMSRPEVAWGLLEEFGVTPETHEIARDVVYTFQARIAERWRDRRVFLTGDAAHTMPPFAGQGLLSSLRDSNNLAWKLDLVLRGLATDALLDTYERERRPHVHAWTQISLAEGRVSCELDPQRAAERDARLLAGEPLDIPHPPNITGPLTADGGPLGHPLAGTLGLQGRIRRGDTVARFDDLLGASRFSVVAMGLDPRTVLSGEQLAWLELIGAIVTEVRADEDVDGTYAAYFSTHGIVAVINRPDFLVFGAARDGVGLARLVDDLRARVTAYAFKDGETVV